MAPSLRQTLLREPTRSYQSIYADGNGPASGYGSASSSIRRPSSIRSSASNDSFARSTSGQSQGGGPAWVNGEWEWSQFGGRKGLTGGARSLYTPSVVAKSIPAPGARQHRNSSMSLRSERIRSDDGDSVRSGRSQGGQSVRSTMSVPNGLNGRRRPSSRDIANAVDNVGMPSSSAISLGPRRPRTQSANSVSNATSTSRRRYDDLPSISAGFDQQTTSRRYSTAPVAAPITTSSRPSSTRPLRPTVTSSPSPGSATSSSRPTRSKSPLRHYSEETTPSLTSSASSAPSSPPATPVHSIPNLASPLAIDAKAQSQKGYQSPEAILASPAEQGSRGEQPAVDQIPESTTEQASEKMPKGFYSVDEFFAIAGTGSSASGPAVPAPEPAERSRQESDDVSFKTAAEVEPPSPPTLHAQPSVPRLKLTRTESDQTRAGIKGAVDLDAESDEDEPSPTDADVASVARVAEDDEPASRDPSPRRRQYSAPEPSTVSSEPSYEVVRSSKTPRSASSSAVDGSELGEQEEAEPASVDVPDWLKRIRALGEPVEVIQPRIPAAKAKKLTPPPHWTVIQLRAQEQQNSRPPNMPRPRSVGSLRNRGGHLVGLPGVAEEEEPPVPSFPAWLSKKEKDADGNLRPVSPNGQQGLSRASSITSTSSGADDPNHRRTRSMDLAPGERPSISPLHRAVSLTSASSSRTASLSPSRTSSTKSKKDYDLAEIAVGAAKPKRTSIFFQPPLASSKAVREPEPILEVVNTPKTMSTSSSPAVSRRSSPPRRAASLREALALRDNAYLSSRPKRDEDATSSYGGSQISMMSAPQLSPVRPPRNPARRSSLSTTNGGNAKATETPLSNRSPSRPASISYSSLRERPQSRPTSIAERQPPAPPAPIFPPVEPEPASADPSSGLSVSAAPSRAVSLSSGRTSRPLSSYLPPSSLDVEMSSLAISPRVDVGKKTSKRFSLFRSSSSATHSSRRFDPSLDLLYEPLDFKTFQKRLKNDEVLIEAISVGIDRWDVDKAWSVAKTTGGEGWVPGRGVYGKVLARGEGITRVKKGDLVWGQSPLKKSSSLASLVVLSRDNVSLAPQLEQNQADQIAALSTDAVTAMQVMESFAKGLPKGSKILVLNAHEGIGYLCLQLARYLRPGHSGSRDLWIVAQIPVSVADGEAFCRNAGATDVIRDEPLSALNGLHEGSFDVVIDTIGGRRLYDASRRILHNSGSFVTTVGDSLGLEGSASGPSNYQTSLRSLRRTFFKKDKKSVSYWLASHEVDERDAVREVLDKVKVAVEAGKLEAKVRTGRTYAFSDARKAFDPNEVAVDGSYGAVVRIKEF
ncbi:hypothetical protein JCM10212_005046 [Sporobolomyces blumeae]